MSGDGGDGSHKHTDEETWQWVQKGLGRVEKYRPTGPSLESIILERRPQQSSSSIRFSASPAIPMAAILLIVALVMIRPSILPTSGAGPSLSTSSVPSPTPVATPIVGGTLARCDTSVPPAPSFLAAEDQPVPLSGRHGIGGNPIQLQGMQIGLGEAHANEISVLWPAIAPAGLPLRLALLSPAGKGVPAQDQLLYLVYSPTMANQPAVTTVLLDGGWILAEGLPQSRAADSIVQQLEMTGAGGHVKVVIVAGMRVAVVHADPIDQSGNRHWGLYWSDGIRGMSLQAMDNPDRLLQYVRTLYCGA